MRRIAFLAVLVVAAGRLASAAAAETIHWQTDLRAAVQQAADDGRPVLIFVNSAHCHYCTKMRRETYAHPAIARQVNASFVPVLVSAERAPELVRQLGVSAFPTTLVVSPEARVIQRIRGFVGPRDFHHRLAAVLHENHYAAR